jgi:hypothetical protein
LQLIGQLGQGLRKDLAFYQSIIGRIDHDLKQLIIEKIDHYLYLNLLLQLSFEYKLEEIRVLLLKYDKIGTFNNNTNNISLIINKSQIIQVSELFFCFFLHASCSPLATPSSLRQIR